VVREQATKISLGFGFVEFDTEESAADSITKLNGLKAGSKQIKVTYYRHSVPELKDANLCISQLPKHLRLSEQVDLVGRFGSYHQLQCCNRQNYKRIGFVRFSTNKEAEEIRTALDGQKRCRYVHMCSE